MENEWIFAINDYADADSFVVTINPKDFWEESGHLDDISPSRTMYEQMDLMGFAELMENTWEPMNKISREDAKELMEMNGFIHSPDMEEWLKQFGEE